MLRVQMLALGHISTGAVGTTGADAASATGLLSDRTGLAGKAETALSTAGAPIFGATALPGMDAAGSGLVGTVTGSLGVMSGTGTGALAAGSGDGDSNTTGALRKAK